jgi:hypothetical protein
MRAAPVVTLAASTVIVCALVVAAGAATRAVAICNPAFEYCNPGQLQAGVYTTRYFLPGMQVNVPGSGWSSEQDSTTEFKLSLPGYPNPNTTPLIRFWIDPRASTPCSDKVIPVNMTTPVRAVHWLRNNKNLTVSAPRRTTIAGKLQALTVDLNVSKTAPRCSGAPAVAADYFLFFGGTAPAPTDIAPQHTPGVKDAFGTGRGELVRLYLAQIGPPAHLFVVGIDVPNRIGGPPMRKRFAQVNGIATSILADLQLPATLPPKQN